MKLNKIRWSMLALVVALAFVGMTGGAAMAQDEVGISVVDEFLDPVAGEDFLVKFEWSNGVNSFWTGFIEPDDEGGGEYVWNVPEPEGGWSVVSWYVLCPAYFDPMDPNSYYVNHPIPGTAWFEWQVDTTP